MFCEMLTKDPFKEKSISDNCFHFTNNMTLLKSVIITENL